MVRAAHALLGLTMTHMLLKLLGLTQKRPLGLSPIQYNCHPRVDFGISDPLYAVGVRVLK